MMMPAIRPLASITLLFGAGLLAAGQFAKIAVPFSEFEAAYPSTGDDISWLLSLISLMGAALGVAAGGLVSAVGARRVLYFGLALGIAVSVYQASLPPFPALLGSRVIEGLSHLSIVVAAPTLIVQIAASDWRGRAMVLWSTHFAVAFALMAWLGIPFVSEFGVKHLFLGHGAALLLVTVALALTLPAPKQDIQPTRRLRLKEFIRDHVRAYSSRSIITPGIGWTSYTLTFVALLAILPSRFSNDFNDVLTGILPLISIAASILLVPVLLRRMKAIPIVVMGFSAAILVVSSTVLGMHISMVAIGLYATLGLIQGATFAAIPELNSDISGQALGYGVVTQFGNLGNLIGAPLLLFVLDHFGESGLITAAAMIYAAAVISHSVLRR